MARSSNPGTAVAVALFLVILSSSSCEEETVFSNAVTSEAPIQAVSATAQSVGSSSDPFTRRQTVWVDVGYHSPYPLLFPRMKPLPAGAATSFRLSVNDTCGLFTLFHTVKQAAGFGPPPHIHYAEDEYFISAGTGSTRVFTNQKATKLTPGRLPGFNVPPVKAGSVVFTGKGNGVDKWAGQLAMSPAGNVHYFVRETNITDFFTVYLDGFADEDIINYVIYGDPTPVELLRYSGLYGVPHDMTGKFVGYNDPTGALKPYREARGPIDVPDAADQARRLQALFDTVERKGCCKACL